MQGKCSFTKHNVIALDRCVYYDTDDRVARETFNGSLRVESFLRPAEAPMLLE
jgi:hypothetical protein